MNIEISQILTQIIAFLLMLWVLKKFGWKPLLNTLEERQKKIQAEFDSIAKEKQETKTLHETYQEKLRGIESEARHKIQEAVGQGRKIAMEIQKEAHDDARELIEKAKREVNNEVEKAKSQLKNSLIDMVTATTEKILQEKLDDPEHQKLIEEFVKEATLK